VPAALPATLIARTGVVAEPRWSPDGQRLGWIEGRAGRFDLVVAGAPGAVDRAPVVVTAETGVAGTRATGGGIWCWVGAAHVAAVAPDGRLVLVPVDGGSMRTLARDGRAGAPAAAADGSRVAFVLERADACDVAVVDVDTSSWPRRVSHADFAWDPAWSPDGTRLAWHEWDLDAMSWDASRIVVGDARGLGTEGAAKVVAGGAGISVGQPRFSPSGDALAWVTDERGWWNVFVADADGAGPRPVAPEPFEQAEPAWGLGQRSFAWSPDGRAIALCRNESGFGRLLAVALDAPLDRGTVHELERGWHHGLDWGPAGIAAVRSGARTPPVTCIIGAPGSSSAPATAAPPGRREVVAHAAPAGVRRDGLVEPEAVTWEADDETTIYGLLFRPDREDAGRARLVVDVHGGPTGQATVQWKPLHQHLVTSGFAVLAPDPRGSTGHGRAYAQALAGRWGELDVADCAAGIRAAVDRGWCDRERVVVSGASSGGLTALLLAVRHPDLVRAVVAMYAVTDLVHLAATTHRFESRSIDWLVGPLVRDAARYRDRSPITHAADLRAPLLLLHGADDTVVPPEQAASLTSAVRAAGGTVEHHEYEGEGHGWSREDTLLDVYARLDDFLRRHAAG
jgi:dipeptidyl aminopeptidase/acylaminoacyl peptidase